ncbi:MAG: hypothetical protein NTY84_09715, partial [Verrucomicrobia bacterium]|nr:hypothetical protein [Verrucomicrobiota bacterium]
MPTPEPTNKFRICGESLFRWGVWFFVATLVWIRAVDGGHSPWETNEALELLKVRVLKADSQWYRTMWDDQPATLMWMLHGWFAVTGASVEAARVLVTALMTVALSAVAARAESLVGRWAGLALAPLLLVNPELTQLMGACMLEPTSIALALMGGLLFWSRLERPTGWTIVGAGALTAWALSVKLTAALPAQLAFWVFLHALWRARQGDRALRLRIVGNALLFGGVAIGGAGLLLAAGGHDWSTVHDSHVRGVFGEGGWAELRDRTNTRALTDVWWDAYASLALVPTSLLLAWRHPRIWRWVLPWAMTLVVSTGVLWVYPFWHRYYLIHVALPMAALVAPTVTVTGRALLSLLRMWAWRRGGEMGTGSTGRQRMAWGLGAALVACTMAAEGLVLAENLHAVRRTVNPDRDLDAQAMLEMLERHGSWTGMVFASSPDLTLFRSG